MHTALIAVTNETGKGLLLLWDRRLNTLSQLVMLAGLFLGISFIVGEGSFDSTRLAPVLLGYLLWAYARVVIFGVSTELVGEAQAGTLEQIALSPTPAPLLLLGRVAALLASTSLMIGLVGVVLALLLGIHLPVGPAGLVVLALTLAGLLGFGLLLGGLTLVFKQIASLADLLQNAILFLNGALVPIERFPDWLAALARLVPTTQGISLLRRVVLDGQSLAAVWADGSLGNLTIHAAVFLAGGWLAYAWCECIAKRQGSLGQY
jgi:ABC-2 type transport system permease protein